MKTGSNIRLRKDGRYEARYIKGRDENGKILYGYCYGTSYQEAETKREKRIRRLQQIREMNLLILGSGSHGQEVKELAQSLRIFRKISFLDDIYPNRAIGPCRNFEQYLDEYPVAIPAIGDTKVRMRWMEELIRARFVIPTLIHPTAIISPSAEIGTGTVICARVTVGTGAVIGKGCIVSSGATVNRNVTLNDWEYVECGETVGIARRRE